MERILEYNQDIDGIVWQNHYAQELQEFITDILRV